MNGKYLLISELFAPTRGGSAVWFEKVYPFLGASTSHVVTSAVPGGAEFDASFPLRVHRLSLERKPYLKPESLALYLKLLLRSLSLGVGGGFDGIHAGRVLPEGLVALLVARLLRKPCLIYAHGEEITTWTQPGKQKALRHVYRKADKVIANSDFTRRLLIDIGVKPERIHLIHPGVDLDTFKPDLDTAALDEKYGLEDRKVIFSVGRLSRRKGFDQVLRAMPEILKAEPEARYVIGGIGEDMEYLRGIIKELKLEDKVIMPGRISEDELPCWYNRCELFIMPNRKVGEDTEGFGMVFIEAGACGKPVIAGMEGGTGDAVIDNETGFRIDGTDTGQISQAILRLLGDKQLAARLGQNGLKRAREQFGWKHVAQKTQRILQ